MMDELAISIDLAPSPVVLGGNFDQYQEQQVRKMDKFSWYLTVLTGILGCLNGLYAYSINFTWTHNSPLFFFLLFLQWSCCLDKRSSLWSLRITFVLCYIGGFVLPDSVMVPYWHDQLARFGYELLTPWIIFRVVLAVMFLAMYRTSMVARDAIQRQHNDKTINLSVKIASQFAAASPYIIFVTFNMFASISSIIEESRAYASHTPLCRYTPQEQSRNNIEYQCAAPEDARTDSWERGPHLTSHSSLGIASIPVFTSPTMYLNFTESIKAAETFEDSTTTNTTMFLTYNDYVRIVAQRNYIDDLKTYLSYMMQGVVFVIVLFVTEIFTRVTRASLDDVFSFNVTRLEAFIVLNTLTLIFLSMYLSSLNGKTLGHQLEAVMLLTAIAISTIFVATYVMCNRVINDKVEKVLTRPQRASTANAPPSS
eukprot:CAMPEP_0118641306 /NCGR_PEP_ID=MMETSP0785-20121206/5210_1 /TAXON_ID=91992 /ORGANISM="Bolidomonas pacifica, Strain CCMP 1866" /LENGTH=424 /DNA_ID=CAMNT_0006532739 /DNA_START=143 /DNA_END=1413 /DNA_ORIENTATION=-